MTDNENRKIVFEPGAPEFGGPAGAKKSKYITPESTRGESNRWQYTLVGVRPYEPSDFDEFAKFYKNSSAESPWNEVWKEGQESRLIELVESQKNPTLLVAENCFFFLGFASGYQIPAEEYQAIEGLVSPNACYVAELAVDSRYWKRCIGTDLGLELENEAYRKGMPEIVLKVDQKNTAGIALCKSLGYAPLESKSGLDSLMCDPKSPDRLYFARRTEIRPLTEI